MGMITTTTQRLGAAFKALTGRDEYVESSLRPFEGSGHYGAKPWPFNYEHAVLHCSGWVYRCVMGNAQAASATPLRMYVRKRTAAHLKAMGYGARTFEGRRVSLSRRKFLHGEYRDHRPSAVVRHKLAEFGDDFEEVTDHPALDLLRTVNPLFNGFELSMMRFVFDQLTGNSYLHPVMSPSLHRPIELWPMPSHMTHLVPGPPEGDEMVAGYVYGNGYTREQFFEIDEVLHKATNRGLRDLHYGYGPMEAAWSTLGLSHSKRISDKALFDNMARPDWVMSIEGAGEDQISRTQERINELKRGVRQVGRALITNGKTKVTTLNFPPKDIGEFAEILEELAGVFGYPIQKLKASYEPKANAETADYGWMKDTINPMLRQDEEWLNQGGYLDLFGDGALLDDAVLAYDDPVPANAESRRLDSQVYVAGGVWTINDDRAEQGLEPVEGGDEPRVNGVALSALDAQAEAQAQAAANPFGGLMLPQAEPKPQAPSPAADPAEIARQVAAALQADKGKSIDRRARATRIAKSLAYPIVRTKAAGSPYGYSRDDGAHPALTATLTGTYAKDGLPWVGWMEPADASWIGFLAADGWLVVFDERDADGEVMGKPWAVMRDDLLPDQRGAESIVADLKEPFGLTDEQAGRILGRYYTQAAGRTIETDARAELAKHLADANDRAMMQGMDKALRIKALTKRIRERHDASAVMLMVTGDASDQAFHFNNYDLDPADIAPEGVEVEPHVTAKWGLTTDRFEDVAPVLREAQPIHVRFGKVALFESDKHDVVYVAVESEQMEALHAALSELPNTEPDRPYTPHMTLAYVKPGEGKKYAGSDAFEGMEAVLHTMIFSASNGDTSVVTLRREANKKACGCPDSVTVSFWPFNNGEMDAAHLPVGFKGYPGGLIKADTPDDGDADDTQRDGEPETPIQRFARMLAEFFAEQGERALAAMPTGKAARRIKRDLTDDERREAALKDPRLRAVLDAIDDPKALEPIIADALKPMVAAGAQAGADVLGQTGADLGDFAVDFDVSNPLVERAARERSLDLAGDLNQTTLNRLRDSLADGIAKGESTAQLTARVREQFDSFTGPRAESVARTESALAYEQGQQRAWQASGVVESKKWLLAPNACEFCRSVAAQFDKKKVALDGEFLPKGATLRGADGGTMDISYRTIDGPPLHVNCRCDLIPVLGGDFADLGKALTDNDRETITKFWRRRADADHHRDQPGAGGPAGVPG